ncbi:hypothetical protein ACEWY4_007550 [Coilia grayii]|uniref:HAT C-terminal dimerisation domain-containing protein n=1 Tax=Coilia grayii TaxID=363190 RepID=A0ABD1KHK1_9TELE
MLIQEEKMRADAVFIRGGFSNWLKATEKFREHEKSAFHLDAVSKVAALNSTPISALLSEVVAKEQNTARVVLEEAFKTARYLVRQGLPHRGHDHRDGHFWQLMHDRTEPPEARQWMLRRDNWLSDNIQNEIIEQLAHAVQRKLVQEASTSHYFGLTADSTTDISSSEQFSCHLHFVDTDMYLQLKMLGGLTKDQTFLTVQDLARFMSALHPQTRGLFSEVERLVHLCLCLPVSTACSERSFSALRRLKTWLRSTVSQRRLTHMALLHIHKNVLDGLNLHEIIGEFIGQTPERKSTFGVKN